MCRAISAIDVYVVGVDVAKQWIIPLAVLILVLSTLGATQAQMSTITISPTPDSIKILQNGTISPSTAPIKQSGNLYQLTDNINKTIIIERNNAVLDGRGFTIDGSGSDNGQAAINLTCTGTTVKSFQFKDWQVGVLGVYDNNRVEGNDFSNVIMDVAVYADNYEITQNYLNYVRIVGSNIDIHENEIQTNDYGTAFWISNSTNVKIEANIVKFTNWTTSFISIYASDVRVYHNNFLNSEAMQLSRGQLYAFGYSEESNVVWDNGYPSGGNYWSDFSARYSNASETNDSGIWDTNYRIQPDFALNLFDQYPLQNPYPIQVAALPTPPPVGSINDIPTPSVPELPTWVLPMLLVAAVFAVVGWKIRTNRAPATIISAAKVSKQSRLFPEDCYYRLGEFCTVRYSLALDEQR